MSLVIGMALKVCPTAGNCRRYRLLGQFFVVDIANES